MYGRLSDILRKISPYLKKEDRIIDIGCGSCEVCKHLQNDGYAVTPVDVKNRSFFRNIKPIIYDGKKLPFPDNSFDVSLLITVLHHTQDPVAVLSEAKRVSKRIIVMEDLYQGKAQKYLTFAMDSILNLEFFGHPHTNMTKEEWEHLFKELKLTKKGENIHDFWKFFTSGTFYLVK
jgi:ubiquinone/menaquinone biosynthesis C-methylase UbiE